MLKRIFWFLIFLLSAFSCKPKEELSIVFGGDVMLDRAIRAQINRLGVSYFTADLSAEFSKADYAVINLECPVTDKPSPLTKKYVFRAEPTWLPELRNVGITHCIMANNHSYDHGRAGIIATAKNLESAGIIPIGFGQTQQSACEPVLVRKNGIEVAIFSSVTLPLEAWMYLPDSPGMCQATIDDLKQTVAAFRLANPKTFIVVTLHWGVEYQPIPTSMQRHQATELIDAGTDAIIGHHPHVVQSYERINGKPVFYSIGNLIFDNPRAITHRGILVKLLVRSSSHEVIVIPYEAVDNKPVIVHKEIREFYKVSIQQVTKSCSIFTKDSQCN